MSYLIKEVVDMWLQWISRCAVATAWFDYVRAIPEGIVAHGSISNERFEFIVLPVVTNSFVTTEEEIQAMQFSLIETPHGVVAVEDDDADCCESTILVALADEQFRVASETTVNVHESYYIYPGLRVVVCSGPVGAWLVLADEDGRRIVFIIGCDPSGSHSAWYSSRDYAALCAWDYAHNHLRLRRRLRAPAEA